MGINETVFGSFRNQFGSLQLAMQVNRVAIIGGRQRGNLRGKLVGYLHFNEMEDARVQLFKAEVDGVPHVLFQAYLEQLLVIVRAGDM